jgi:hypothetical protein
MAASVAAPRIIVNRQRIADMRAAGKTRAEIAAQLSMSTRTVSRLWKPATSEALNFRQTCPAVGKRLGTASMPASMAGPERVCDLGRLHQAGRFLGFVWPPLSQPII